MSLAPVLPSVICEDHPSALIMEDYRAGDMICSECGRVVGDRVVDVGPEWRVFNDDHGSKDKSRVGTSEDLVMGVNELSTSIAFDPRRISEDSGSYLRYQHRISMTSSDRSLLKVCAEISNMAERVNLSKDIVTRAQKLFKKLEELKTLKGKSIYAIASACLYIACRQEGVPRTFKEICAISRVSKKEIGRTFKMVVNCLEAKVDSVQSGDFMSRFCAGVGLPIHIQKAAAHIAKMASKLDLAPGRSPVSVASAAIYLASLAAGEKKTQKEIGEVTGVADITIRLCYRLLLPRASELFPGDFLFTVPINKLPLY